MMELPAVKETYVEPETYARYVSGYIDGNPEYDFWNSYFVILNFPEDRIVSLVSKDSQ